MPQRTPQQELLATIRRSKLPFHFVSKSRSNDAFLPIPFPPAPNAEMLTKKSLTIRSSLARIAPIVFISRHHIEFTGALCQQAGLHGDDLVGELLDLGLQLPHLRCLLCIAGVKTLMFSLPLRDL